MTGTPDLEAPAPPRGGRAAPVVDELLEPLAELRGPSSAARSRAQYGRRAQPRPASGAGAAESAEMRIVASTPTAEAVDGAERPRRFGAEAAPLTWGADPTRPAASAASEDRHRTGGVRSGPDDTAEAVAVRCGCGAYRILHYARSNPNDPAEQPVDGFCRQSRWSA